MKPELLETLLLDRALGELSPAVAALLDAHLAHDPAAARHAAELANTLQLARAAVAVPSEAPRRPLDVDRLRRAHHAVRATTRRREILRLAACLALGLVGGWLLRPARGSGAPPVIIAIATPRATEPANHFWSVRHFAQDTATPSPEKKL
jgi:anti-sigma factor RsiW